MEVKMDNFENITEDSIKNLSIEEMINLKLDAEEKIQEIDDLIKKCDKILNSEV